MKDGLLAAETAILSLQKLLFKEGETNYQIENSLSKIKNALKAIEEDGLSEEEKERKRIERKYKQKLEERKLRNHK